MVDCFSRYKHLGQFAPLGGEQTAAQLPGDWVSIGHSSQWMWYSVYARYYVPIGLLYSPNLLNFKILLLPSSNVSIQSIEQQASKLAHKGVSSFRLDKTFCFREGLKSHIREFNIFHSPALEYFGAILNFF